MKRFWAHATVACEDGRFVIQLDGRPMRIPGGAPLLLASRALADAVAAEWQAAGGARDGVLSMEEVPLTRLAGTAQDRIAPDPAPVADALARYAETDLLCYRAMHPEQLVVREAKAWQPWLDWLARVHGARLEATEGVRHLAQDPVALARVHQVMAAQSPAVLAGLGIVVPALGSAVLGLAVAEGALEPAAAHELACLDELFEVEAWGEDTEGRRRREAVGADVALAARFMALSGLP